MEETGAQGLCGNEQGERDGSVESKERGCGYVEYDKAGEVTKICFAGCRLDGTLPEGDLGMPHLTHLDLGANAASYPSRTGLKGMRENLGEGNGVVCRVYVHFLRRCSAACGGGADVQ